MTDVATQQAPAARQPSRAMKAGEFLAHSRDVLEAPFRLIPEAMKLWPTDLPWHRPGHPHALARATEWLDTMPPRPQVETTRETIASALASPPDRAMTALAVGTLLEAFPNAGKETRETYFATLLHDAIDSGTGPFLMAEACKTIRRKSTFLPTVGEMLSAIASVRFTASEAVSRLDAVLQCWDRCDELVALHAGPAQWPDSCWMDALMAWGEEGAGLWADHLGPKPGEPGCIVPQSAKDAYRRYVDYRP